jgi:hypothetical protein
MTLNIEVKGDPASIMATGYWLNRAKLVVDTAGTAAFGAGTTSVANWDGDAGDGFRVVMGRIGRAADGLATKTFSTGAALVTFGHQLQAVKNQMASARQIAVTGGLTTTATLIMDPGPAPQPPGTLPPDATPQQKTAHASAVSAGAAYAKKVAAYQKAGPIVTAARTAEQKAQRALGAGPLKDLATVTDIGVGATTGAAEAASKFRVNAAHFDALATRAARAVRPGSSLTSPANRADALRKLANFAILAEQNRVAAESSLLGRFGAAQPQWVKNLLQKPVSGGVPQPKPDVVKKAPKVGAQEPTWLRVTKGTVKVGGRVPLLGIGLAAVGVGLDIATGTDPVKAVVTGAAGVVGGVVGGAIGALAGFGVAGPPGAVVGGVVGGVVVGSVASEFAGSFFPE